MKMQKIVNNVLLKKCNSNMFYLYKYNTIFEFIEINRTAQFLNTDSRLCKNDNFQVSRLIIIEPLGNHSFVTHSHTLTRTRAHTYAYTITYTNTYTHTHTDIQTNTHIQTQTDSQTNTHLHTSTYRHKQTRTHAHKHTHTHTNIHTRTHT